MLKASRGSTWNKTGLCRESDERKAFHVERRSRPAAQAEAPFAVPHDEKGGSYHGQP